jgi:RNA polymerase sigma-70 factor (ECF subfamily)
MTALGSEALGLLDNAAEQPPEHTLAARFAAGDARAFDEVVAMYQSRVERLAQRLLGYRGDVDDAVQETFLSALTHASRCRGERGLWPWLTTIAVNACRSQRRRAWVREKFLRMHRAERHEPAADASAASDESLSRVRNALDRLGARDREVIVLHCLEEMPVNDVAVVLGISNNAVLVRLHRARHRLRAELGESTD